jgi:hypothetical protein
MKLKKFIKECRENDVFKNLSIYIVSSWVLLQVVALVAEPVGLPDSTLTYLLIILLIGFPLYIYLLWKYQLTDNIKRKPLIDNKGNPIPGKFSKSPFQKIYFFFLSIISIVSIGVVAMVVDKKFVQGDVLKDIPTGDKIAVLRFDNNTGDEKYDIAGKMATDWIIHGITQNQLGQVISPEIIDDYSEILKASIIPSTETQVMTDYLKPSKIIDGEYYLNKNKLIFQCSITDEIMNKTLISFEPVECDLDAPLDCIEALKQRILGYLILEDDQILSLQEHPPNFKAYQLFNNAKNKYQNKEEFLKLLDLAIGEDSTYFEPKVYKIMYNYNKANYSTADSLLRQLSIKTGTYDRQQVLLNLYDALLKGDHKKAHVYQKKEYNITPFHMETNSNMMIISLQLVNRPEEIDSVFAEVDMEGWDLTKCNFCVERYKMKAMADIEFKRYEKAIALLKDFANEKELITLKNVLLRAYVRSENNQAADDLLASVPFTTSGNQWMYVNLFAAKEFIWMDKQNLANKYLDSIISELIKNEGDLGEDLQKLLAESLFYREDYAESEEVLKRILNSDPKLITINALLAIVHQKNNNKPAALDRLQALEDLREDYQYGNIDYALAQYYASVSDDENTIKYLMKAIAEGHWYETGSFQNDPLFKAYFETPAFKRVLKFWH